MSTQSGNHAILQMARHVPHRYFNNTAEALAELMRLGIVERASVPSTKQAVAAYQQHRYRLTSMGEYWVLQLNSAKITAYETLFKPLWRNHPQFAGYLCVLTPGTFVVPTAKWTEVSREEASMNGRVAYMQFLAARAARAVQAGVTRWQATADEI